MVTMARLKWLAGASLVGAALLGTFWAAGCGDSNAPFFHGKNSPKPARHG